MPDLTDLTVEREIVIDAPLDVVWRTITEPDQITQWFADEVTFDAQPGAEGTFVFDEHARNSRFRVALVVEAVEPPHRFSFRWGHPDDVAADDSNSVLVEFTLVAETSEQTRLRVAETGLRTVAWTDARKADYADDHRNGWAYHLGRLHGLFSGSTSTPAR
jgi:uncharacterized protein YndB with AHSA1/START domain